MGQVVAEANADQLPEILAAINISDPLAANLVTGRPPTRLPSGN